MKQQTQINKIEWKEVSLGDKDYFEIVGSGINEFTGKKDYLSTESIKGTKIEKIECPVTYEDRPSRANMQPIINSVWFAKMQSTLKVYAFTKNNEKEINQYILSTGFTGIKILNRNISPEYIRIYLATDRFNLEKDKLCTGSTQRGINNSFIIKIKIPIPFLPDGTPDIKEQEKIISILEENERQLRRVKTAERLFDEYLKSMFNEIFENHLKNRKDYKKITEFVPKDKNAIKAGPFGSSLKKECYVLKGYKIYGQEQVIRNDLNFGDYYISQEKYEELKNYQVKEGDILISLVGTYGKISIVPKNFEQGIINPRLMKITLDNQKMIPTFFKYLFNSDAVKKELANSSHGGTMDIVNVGIIKSIGFPLPPLPLQQKFAQIVEHIEKMKENVNKTKQNAEELSNSLMEKAFRGEL